MNNWINENYKELVLICKKVSKEDNVDDLLQCCVEQFITNKKVAEVPDEQKLYFFTKIVKNNYYSNTSVYHKNHRKFMYDELNGYEAQYEDYEEPEINMDWVRNELNKLKQNDWYYSRLFELYIEEGASITKLSARTTIPINSISRDINKIRRILRAKREKQLK